MQVLIWRLRELIQSADVSIGILQQFASVRIFSVPRLLDEQNSDRVVLIFHAENEIWITICTNEPDFTVHKESNNAMLFVLKVRAAHESSLYQGLLRLG